MHPNPAFRTESAELNLQFARERGFGQLGIAVGDLPLAAHVPFVLLGDGSYAELHLLRSNPLARAVREPRPALLAVSGPDGYVSPDWYRIDGQVPTWNYVAVHLRGRLIPLPDTELSGTLERLSDTFEARLAPKLPWSLDKLPPEARDRMLRAIHPFRLEIETVDGTWKLNQNKPAAARIAAATGVEAHGIGQETALLAGLMRGLGD